MEPSKQFNIDETIKTLQSLNTSPSAYKLDEFQNFLQQMLVLFTRFGSILARAFKDIKQKSEILSRNAEQSGINIIQDQIRMEIEQKKEQMNGENNQERYESSSRTMLRIIWFIDFDYWFIKGLRDDQNMSISQISKNAYQKAFATRHSTSIQIMAKLLLNLSPNRNTVYGYFMSMNNPEKELVIEKIGSLYVEIEQLRSSLYQFYESNNLMNLP